MGTCGQPGYVFRDFCVEQGFDLIIFCLNQGIDFINFCLKPVFFIAHKNSLRVSSTNALNSWVSKSEFCLKQGSEISDFCLTQCQGMRGWGAPPRPRIYRVPFPRGFAPRKKIRNSESRKFLLVESGIECFKNEEFSSRNPESLS